MKNDRRKFIQQASILAASAAFLPTLSCNSTAPDQKENTAKAVENKVPNQSKGFGLQLYTLRDDMPADPKGVLQKIASYGYQYLEGYEGQQGMFWDMKPKDFKMYLDDLGLKMIASHCDVSKDFEQKAAEAAVIGMPYLIFPWMPAQEKADDWKKLADQFNSYGAICKKNGIRFAFHNHDHSFHEIEGQLPQDILMDHTDPELVDFEIDVYWVVTAGKDPIAYMEKYPDRFRLCHLKDRIKDAPLSEREASCDLGTGSIDFNKIAQTASRQGVEYYILEQERYDGSTPLKSAERGATFMKELFSS